MADPSWRVAYSDNEKYRCRILVLWSLSIAGNRWVRVLLKVYMQKKIVHMDTKVLQTMARK
jgi:hypothetical protein